MSSFNCCSWPAYRFLSRVRWSGILSSLRIFHSLFWSTVKVFDIVNKAEIYVSLEFPCFFDDPVGVGNLISDSSAFSKTSLNIWKFMVLVLLNPGLENFEHYFASMWDECNCAVVWAFFGIVKLSLSCDNLLTVSESVIGYSLIWLSDYLPHYSIIKDHGFPFNSYH